MKSILLRAGLLAGFLLLGWSFQQASAAMTIPSKCSTYGEIKANQNPSFQYINCLLTNAALDADIPPEVVKAVASQESGWRQFDNNGQPFTSADGGIGIMQITNQSSYDQQKLKDDIWYNIEAGVEILKNMYNRTDLPKIAGAGADTIENWYFPVMAYNGTKPVNSPLHQSDGSKNSNAYQEKVFTLLEQDSFLNDTELGQFPFSTADFTYSTDSDTNIVFNKMEYVMTSLLNASAYLFQTGDKVVTKNSVNLRVQPGSSAEIQTTLEKGITLLITGEFSYDQSLNSQNTFVWYPVKTADQKFAGYISSAYLTGKLEPPSVNSVDDNDTSLSGTASENTKVQIKNGTVLIAIGAADATGAFKVKIPVQKAGTQLTIFYMDKLNAQSPSKAVIVADKTAPPVPGVNAVTNKSTEITGKAEANATVTVTISRKSFIAKADRYGNYKVAIPVQNTGTKISVTAKDLAKNISAAKSITCIRVAPNIPNVNKVRYFSTSVTGNSEKYATVSIKIGKKTYTSKANFYGNFKVSILKKPAGTRLYVNAKDTKGKISATRTVIVSK